MKSITIYERRGFLYACPYAHTVHGVGILTGPCIKLPAETTTPAELGEAALQTLEQAGAIVPHPEDWSKLPPSPILAVAGVKSWTTFSKGARTIEIALRENGLYLTPTRQEGRLNFMPLDDDEELHLPAHPTATQLGEAIKQALARCR